MQINVSTNGVNLCRKVSLTQLKSHRANERHCAFHISLCIYIYIYISVWEGRSGIFPKLTTVIRNPLQTCVHIYSHYLYIWKVWEAMELCSAVCVLWCRCSLLRTLNKLFRGVLLCAATQAHILMYAFSTLLVIGLYFHKLHT